MIYLLKWGDGSAWAECVWRHLWLYGSSPAHSIGWLALKVWTYCA